MYWQDHYQYELARLSEPTSEAYTDPLNKNKGKRGAAVVAKRQLEGSKGKKKVSSVYEETLEKIQKNRLKRTDRLRQLDGTSMIKHDTLPPTPSQPNDSDIALQVMLDDVDVQTCFICNQRLYGDLEAVNLHIDNCLTNPTPDVEEETELDETEEEDVDSDNETTPRLQQQQQAVGAGSATNSWEEYEWAGQVRVRASAMMEGGYGGAGFATSSKRDEDEDEEDLDVEDDDAAQFGQSQYTERDIVVNMDDDTEDASALREMVSGGTMRTPTSETEGERQGFEETVSVSGWNHHLKKEAHHSTGEGHSKLIIDSLKSRIHQLENASRSTPRCLICLESYKTPLTSIVCWHVHCEQCWLQTLGSKKLCPQCQKITTPSDLRRIYL
ncbi:uncharacterized protein EV154DRAFT_203113 [Mucor mucedo]|uniref:uncharacterized protein n=1 Tax=Mucor mucedo TaxID=29922 RepID=UPI0022210C1C|nr:uncharacterized protein EV154DRAFT_203113 [Mucor mucedo]KAI7892063.1 hypothetical protein EV154DRAFT_203113 [Mucor mucedo]